MGNEMKDDSQVSDELVGGRLCHTWKSGILEGTYCAGLPKVFLFVRQVGKVWEVSGDAKIVGSTTGAPEVSVTVGVAALGRLQALGNGRKW